MPETDKADPDLPGDADFRPVSDSKSCGGLVFQLQPVSIEEQQVIHHNRLRYSELQRLRLGQPNLYEQTRYR